MKVWRRASGDFVSLIEIRVHLIRDIFGNIRMGLNHTAVMLSPEGLKTFVLPHRKLFPNISTQGSG